MIKVKKMIMVSGFIGKGVDLVMRETLSTIYEGKRSLSLPKRATRVIISQLDITSPSYQTVVRRGWECGGALIWKWAGEVMGYGDRIWIPREEIGEKGRILFARHHWIISCFAFCSPFRVDGIGRPIGNGNKKRKRSQYRGSGEKNRAKPI